MVSIPFSTFTWISFCSSLEGPRATRSRLSCRSCPPPATTRVSRRRRAATSSRRRCGPRGRRTCERVCAHAGQAPSWSPLLDRHDGFLRLRVLFLRVLFLRVALGLEVLSPAGMSCVLGAAELRPDCFDMLLIGERRLGPPLRSGVAFHGVSSRRAPMPLCAWPPPCAPPRSAPRAPSSPPPCARPPCALRAHADEQPAAPGVRAPDGWPHLVAPASGRGRLHANVSARASGGSAAPHATHRRRSVASWLSCLWVFDPASPPHGGPC